MKYTWDVNATLEASGFRVVARSPSVRPRLSKLDQTLPLRFDSRQVPLLSVYC